MGITSQLATIIDEWWTILLPIALLMIFKQYFLNFIIYIQLRFSFSPYTSAGNKVKLHNEWWNIFKITINNVYLERPTEDNGVIILKVNIYKYYKDNIIYKKI